MAAQDASAAHGERLLFFGGLAMWDGGTPFQLDAAYLFDEANPAAGWRDVAPLPRATRSAAAIVWNGRVYVGGGGPSEEMFSAEIHAEGIISWRTETRLPRAEMNCAFGVADGILLGICPSTEHAALYQLRADSWLSSTVALPFAADTTAFVRDRFFVSGADGMALVPPSGMGVVLAPAPPGTSGPCATSNQERLYLLGHDAFSSTLEPNSSVAWDSEPKLPEGRYTPACASTPAAVYVAGGVDHRGAPVYYADAYRARIETATGHLAVWERLPDLPVPTGQGTLIAIGPQ